MQDQGHKEELAGGWPKVCAAAVRLLLLACALGAPYTYSTAEKETFQIPRRAVAKIPGQRASWRQGAISSDGEAYAPCLVPPEDVCFFLVAVRGTARESDEAHILIGPRGGRELVAARGRSRE